MVEVVEVEDAEVGAVRAGCRVLAELRGKVAVVTGGASGIGKGIAGALADEGMHVVIADVEQSALEAAAAELGAVGIRTDVRNAAPSASPSRVRSRRTSSNSRRSSRGLAHGRIRAHARLPHRIRLHLIVPPPWRVAPPVR